MLIQIYKLILFHATFLSQITFLFSQVLTKMFWLFFRFLVQSATAAA